MQVKCKKLLLNLNWCIESLYEKIVLAHMLGGVIDKEL